MILSCSNISKAFGSTEIIRHASFHIEDHEKAAIVGINGAGKSTLLKSSSESWPPMMERSSFPRERHWDTWRSTRSWAAISPFSTRCWR